jgi:hypothetical protein
MRQKNGNSNAPKFVTKEGKVIIPAGPYRLRPLDVVPEGYEPSPIPLELFQLALNAYIGPTGRAERGYDVAIRLGPSTVALSYRTDDVPDFNHQVLVHIPEHILTPVVICHNGFPPEP